MKVAVLGAGPSGMMAAHAVSQCGYYVDIFDKDPSSSRRNSGVYFLHADCDLMLDPVLIKQSVIGHHGKKIDEISKLYGLKVYGKEISKPSIVSVISKSTMTGFNSEHAITRLWDFYGKQVKEGEISNLGQVKGLFDTYDKIISTIPAWVLYPDQKFESVETWIKVGKAPENEAFMFYNINPYCDWYRCSAMFGVFTQEYGYGKHFEKKEGYEYKKVIKVIGDGITSEIKDLFLVGRYGAWNKKTLTHDVYYRTLEWLQ